ncbi:hypothetical protein APECPE136_004728 [Escherichia coli]
MERQIATVYSKKSNRRGVVLKRGCLLHAAEVRWNGLMLVHFKSSQIMCIHSVSW